MRQWQVLPTTPEEKETTPIIDVTTPTTPSGDSIYTYTLRVRNHFGAINSVRKDFREGVVVSFPNQFLESSLVKADLIDPSGTTVTRVKFYSETAYERTDIPLVTDPLLAPRILTPPKIFGTETEISRLWAVAGKVDDNAIPVPVRTWQWYKDGVAIAGASDQYYDLLTADIGSTIYVEQIETNTPDPIAFPSNQVVAQSAPTGIIEYRQPKIQSLPRVGGFAYVGYTLEAKLAPVIDNVSGGQEFQWLRDGVEIPGATGLTYTLTGLDLGAKVAFRQREINGDKQDEEASIGVFVRTLS